MPYDKLSDLPDHIKKLPAKKQHIWRAAFNAAHAGYDPKKDRQRDPKKTRAENRESYAFRVANAAIATNEARPLWSAIRAGLMQERRARGCPMCGGPRAGANGRPLGEAAHGMDNGAAPPGMRRRKKKAVEKSVGRMMEGALAGTVAVREVVRAALAEAVEDHSFTDIEGAVRRAVREKYEAHGNGPTPAMAMMETPYVIEVFTDRAILRWQGKLWAVDYEIDDAGDATLGEPERVRVEYRPVPAGEEE